jgi:predicted RNA-binding protein with PUA-like domain
MKTGDKVFYYHSGDQKAVVGISTVIGEAYPDPTDASGAFVAVKLKADKPLQRPVTLAEIKADPALGDMVLVKNSRLSVQPVTAAEWKIINDLGGA